MQFFQNFLMSPLDQKTVAHSSNMHDCKTGNMPFQIIVARMLGMHLAGAKESFLQELSAFLMIATD